MDLFDVLDANKRVNAENWLTQISVQAAPNLNEEDFRRFIGSLRKEAGHMTKQTPKFDEAGFEALKMQLKIGL
ncbi:hypothetical protein MH117_09665 [Paenibacillus sp. ACRRX]|uniref:hypothetical protein n=1 Tax=Paenibacillus sp. ACRRX TaxID=2918206 RepID=UPI001EF5D7B5|nr:hypothetical protein [Paenibacillus sp. ACRRX]MCG7407690.1 hypothetical protein [Paenibacillus sp. ACRRX]